MFSLSQPKRLWSRLRGLLAGESKKEEPDLDPPDVSRTSRTEDEPQQTTPSTMSRTDFDRGLAELIARQKVLVGGKIQVVDLGRIRDHVGERWPHVCSRIHRIIENTFDQRLTKRDLYTRYEDLSYVIVFGESTADEAALKCALLTKEIVAKVIGSDAGCDRKLELRTAVATLNGLTAADGAAGPGALARRIEDQSASIDLAPPDRPSPGIGQGATLHDLNTLLDSVERELTHLARMVERHPPGSDWAALQSRLSELATALQTTESEILRESFRQCVPSEPVEESDIAARARLYDEAMRRLRELLSRVEASLFRSGSADGAWESRLPTDAWFRYWPAWSYQQKALGVYFCQMMIRYGAEDVPAETAFPEEPDLALLGQHDRTVLRRAVADLETAAQRRMTNIVCVPVHFSALASTATRRNFISLCNSIGPEIRAMLVWEIVNVPAGLWENSIFSIVSTLKPFSRAIFIRRGPDDSDFHVLKAAGLHSVGLDLQCLGRTETQVVPLLNRFAERARRAGLRCHVHGVTTSSLCLLAISAGFDYVSGPGVSEATEMPWGILPFDAERLFLPKFANAIQNDAALLPIIE